MAIVRKRPNYFNTIFDFQIEWERVYLLKEIQAHFLLASKFMDNFKVIGLQSVLYSTYYCQLVGFVIPAQSALSIIL